MPLIPDQDGAPLAPWRESAVRGALTRPGRPFDLPLRREMETATGSDLSRARLIEGRAADTACDAVSADAFTVGHQVVVGSGAEGGARETTLRHELVHVAQTGPTAPSGRLLLGSDSAPAESEARRLSQLGHRAGMGQPARAPAPGPAMVKRQPKQAKQQEPGQLVSAVIDPDASTVTFKTTGGSYVYSAFLPKTLASGTFRFGVEVDAGYDVHLRPPGRAEGPGVFVLASTRPGWPVPAKLAQGKNTISVVVGPRSAKPAGDAGSAQAGAGSKPGSAGGSGEGQDMHISVHKMTAAEFKAMTGASADTLPEGKIVPFDQIPGAQSIADVPVGGESRTDIPGTAAKAATGAWLFTPNPMSFVPRNATGILWTSGHLSVFSRVDGVLTVGGYRGNILWYTELPGVGKVFMDDLLTGVSGGWQNDWLFPNLSGNVKDPQTVIYLPTDKVTAEAFAKQVKDTTFGGEYRYSPPRPPGPGVGTGEAGAWTRLYGKNPAQAVRCTNNCITVPVDLVQQGIGSRPLITLGDETLDIASGIKRPSGDVDPYAQGRAQTMRDYMAHPEGLAPGAKQLAFTKGGIRAVGVIRVGGWVGLLYGFYSTEEHLRSTWDTPEFQRAVGEETGGWAGGILGSALGAAGAAAILCAPAGPVDALCVIGGFLGGLLAGALGGGVGSAVGGWVAEHLDEVAPAFGILTPGWIQKAAAEQDKRDLQKFLDDNPGTNYWDWKRLQDQTEHFLQFPEDFF